MHSGASSPEAFMSFIRTRLSVMMFLEFFIWGAWYPLVFGYLPDLGFDGNQQTIVLACFNVAAIVAMFFSTQFADRNFAAEKFVAFSHLIGGVAMLALGYTTAFWPFFLLMLLHCLFYVPTISITNSIAFANVKDPQKDFGLVRLWGTIGWIAASWPFVLILVDWSRVPQFGSVTFPEWLGAVLGTPKSGAALVKATSYTFVAAGLASLALAALSLALPHTPPKPAAKGESSFAWLQAAKLLAVPFMLVLFVVTFIDATVHQFYFFWTGRYFMSIGISPNWVMPAMSIGQFAEIITMAVLGAFLKQLGWRWTMTIGILGHAVRFAVFALLPFPGPALAVQVLHGVCYAFFFATVYIFVDEFFPKDVRSSAQGLFNLLILGIGPLVGNFVGPRVGEMVKTADVTAAVVNEGAGQEVVVRGVIRDPRVKPLDMLEMTIAEPGKDAYPRPVALSPDRTFKVILGAPVKGTYGVTAMLPAQPGTGLAKEALRVPDLVVGDLTTGNLPQVQASRFDFRRLFLWPSGTALLAAILLLLFFHPPARAAADEQNPFAPAH
jgi:nucleoside transporter